MPDAVLNTLHVLCQFVYMILREKCPLRQRPLTLHPIPSGRPRGPRGQSSCVLTASCVTQQACKGQAGKLGAPYFPGLPGGQTSHLPRPLVGSPEAHRTLTVRDPQAMWRPVAHKATAHHCTLQWLLPPVPCRTGLLGSPKSGHLLLNIGLRVSGSLRPKYY